MEILGDIAAVKQRLAEWRSAGRRIAFVPTMGGLHEGHGACLELARSLADVVVASIFLNPIQFDRPDDLATYPSNHEDDRRFCDAAGVDLLFVPTVTTLYPNGFATFVEVHGDIAQLLCAGSRPGHFRGVCTVVLKLFNIVRPEVAVFGEKDRQQVEIIRHLVRDLDLDVVLAICPTVRDADGLACSTRNHRLSPAAREVARCLPRGLERARRAFAAGERASLRLCEIVYEEALVNPGVEVDYVDVVTPDPFAEVERASPGDLLFAAIFIDGVRLIDHVELGSTALPVTLDD
jgi:pantoate--beta-alanine ligase